MARAIYVIFGSMLILSSCTERMICPAYQSAYIYDKDQLRKKFSYFQEDSTPKILTASKNQYLIAEPTPYRKKLRSLQTVPMQKVYVHVPDSISGKTQEDSVTMAELERAAQSVMDTTMIVDVPRDTTKATGDDSTYVISKDREVRILKYNTPDSLVFDPVTNKYVPQKPKYYVDEVGFNTEQDNYMWYLRRSLVLPDVRLAKMQQAEAKGSEKKRAKGKKKGFFRNLFKKDEAVDIDSAELDLTQPGEEEFDYIDTTETVAPVIRNVNKRTRNDEVETSDEDPIDPTGVQPSRKKKKKKSKDSTEPDVAPVEEKKTEEDEDDGF